MNKTAGEKIGKKYILHYIITVLFILLFATFAFGSTSPNYGDLNDDGTINVKDVVLAIKHVLDLETLNAEQQKLADVNGDGIIDVNDVNLILKYSLGLIDKFPVTADSPADDVYGPDDSPADYVYNSE